MRKLRLDIHGSAAAVAGALTLLVAILIGVLVFYKINSSLTSGAGTSVAIRSLFNNTNTTAQTVFTLMPIVAIVLIAGIILAVVMGFGRSQV